VARLKVTFPCYARSCSQLTVWVAPLLAENESACMGTNARGAAFIVLRGPACMGTNARGAAFIVLRGPACMGTAWAPMLKGLSCGAAGRRMHGTQGLVYCTAGAHCTARARMYGGRCSRDFLCAADPACMRASAEAAPVLAARAQA
jgi:hypothetical protein